MTVPATERRGRLTRLQRVSAMTSVAAVGVSALAFTAAPGQRGGEERATGAELPIHPTAWRTAAKSPAAQQASVEAQSSRATDRARDEARDKARKKAARRAARRAALQRAEAAEQTRRQAEKAREKAERDHARQQAASRSAARREKPATTSESSPSGAPQQVARQIIGDGEQFRCFSNIVERESGWNVHAQNPSGAYGLVQALPGSKMSSAGPDWRHNAATQIRWGLNYMEKRYGSPCGAWSFWQANNWY
jgi:hypothetical protein